MSDERDFTFRVANGVLPLRPTEVQPGDSIVVTESPRIVCRPVALLLYGSTQDLYISDMIIGSRLIYIASGLLPAGMFSQYIPREYRVDLGIGTVRPMDHIEIRVHNRKKDEAIMVAGYFECLVTHNTHGG